MKQTIPDPIQTKNPNPIIQHLSDLHQHPPRSADSKPDAETGVKIITPKLSLAPIQFLPRKGKKDQSTSQPSVKKVGRECTPKRKESVHSWAPRT